MNVYIVRRYAHNNNNNIQKRNVSKTHKIGTASAKTISRKSVIKGFSFSERGHINAG